MSDRAPPKPTPAPWKASGLCVRNPSSQRLYAVIETDDGAHRIAALQSDLSDEECLANARLIAAAPEMLAALQYALTDCCDEWIDQASAAVAKATGA